MKDKFDLIIEDLKNDVQPKIANCDQTLSDKNVQRPEGLRILT